MNLFMLLVATLLCFYPGKTHSRRHQRSRSSSRNCFFPFVYQGITYNRCIHVPGQLDKSWCLHTPVWMGKWGWCNQEEKVGCSVGLIFMLWVQVSPVTDSVCLIGRAMGSPPVSITTTTSLRRVKCHAWKRKRCLVWLDYLDKMFSVMWRRCTNSCKVLRKLKWRLYWGASWDKIVPFQRLRCGERSMSWKPLQKVQRWLHQSRKRSFRKFQMLLWTLD